MEKKRRGWTAGGEVAGQEAYSQRKVEGGGKQEGRGKSSKLGLEMVGKERRV